MRIGITGADGLLGWHLRAYLMTRRDVTAVPCNRQDFAHDETLDRFVKGCDAIVHFAGMNRGDESEVSRVNVEIAQRLVEAIERCGVRPHIVFSSSVHIDRDTAYGRSKRAVEGILAGWAGRSGALYSGFVLPHVFGECGRPYYNSVVSTFCHQLAQGQRPGIDSDGQLELLHAQDVAGLICREIFGPVGGTIRPQGTALSVSQLAERLRSLSASYEALVIPDLRDPLDLRLFNTYRSYLFPAKYPIELRLNVDNRGALFEGVRTLNGGQCFISTTKPGITRGNHFHTRKLERFLVVEGNATIRVRRLLHPAPQVFEVSGANPVFVDMPTLHTHNISNTGPGNLVTLFWSHEFFDPGDPDTFIDPV